MTTAVPAKRKRRWLWWVLGGVFVATVGIAAYVYFSFAWVFLVGPGPGGVSLGLPITVVAGGGGEGFVDGRRDLARMAKPIRLAGLGPDAVVFADIVNHAVRIAHTDGHVETIAGGPDRQGHRDGPAATARFDAPHGVAVREDGVVAVCEASGCTVRLLARSTDGSWTVSTLAGVAGRRGFRDGPAAEALFGAPHAVAWARDGALYVADIGNARIRRVRDGRVETVAGGDDTGDDDGGPGVGTLKWPMDIALDADGSLWIADAGEAKVRRWREGEGLTTPFPGQRLAMPHGIAVTPSGHVAVAELYGHRILRYDPKTGDVATFCGTTEEGADAGRLSKPAAVLAHAGRLWIADMGNGRIVTVPLPE